MPSKPAQGGRGQPQNDNDSRQGGGGRQDNPDGTQSEPARAPGRGPQRETEIDDEDE